MATMLSASHVTKTFGDRRRQTTALEDFSIEIDDQPDRSMITSVVGESGSGKSTLAKLMLGILAPTAGEIAYRGRPVGGMRGADRQDFARDVQVVFQDPFDAFNPFYPVEHALQSTIRGFGLTEDGRTAEELITEVLGLVGLRPEATIGRRPHQLSGGQRQRVMVARAMLLRPRLIIADEPVSMVDASMRASILRTLHDLHTEHGISVIYITHDLATAYQISDRMVVLYRGAVVEAGDVDAVVEHPAHPYTRLLLDSVPSLDPDDYWRTEERGIGEPILAATACRFADRCPAVMEQCRQQEPPTYRVGTDQAATCHLLEGSDVADPVAVGRLLAADDPDDQADGSALTDSSSVDRPTTVNGR